MGLETMNFLEDFVITNPVGGSDPKSEGDNHIRGIKTALKATFVGFAGRFQRIQEKTSAYTAVLNDNGSVIYASSGTWTLTLTAAATLGNGWSVLVYNAGGGTVTIDGDGAETINGSPTLSIADDHAVILYCDGTAFYAIRWALLQAQYVDIQNVSATDRILGRSTAGAGVIEEIICTAAGRALIDDASNAAQRSTLGLGALATLSSVDQSTIDASAIGQGELKTSTGDVTDTTSGGSSGANYTLPGGAYGFYPQTWATGTINVGNGEARIVVDLAAGSAATLIYLKADTNSNGNTMNARQRYVQASGPWDLGDGPIHLFKFLHLDRNGNIRGVYVAPEPPWAYNGPTNIRPDAIINGKKYKRRLHTHPGMSNEEKRQARLAGDFELVEISMEMKNADMHLIPHPFASLNSDSVVVLLDPISDLAEDIRYRLEDGEYMGQAIAQGALIIDNTDLRRAAPARNVHVVRARWRLTP